MSPQKSFSPRALSELFLLGVLWGASFLSVRIALDTIPVMTSVLHRVLWASVVLWAIIFIRRIPVPRDPRIWCAFLVMGLLNNVLPFSLMAWGQLSVEVGLTSILNAATAIFGVVLAAAFFPDERLSPARLLGVVIGFLGVAVAIGLGNFTQFNPNSLAQLAILSGTLSYAFASIWARLKLDKLRPVIAAAGMLSASTLIMLPIAIVIDGVPSISLPWDTWAAIAYYAVFATAGAYLLYYRVLAQAGSGNLMLVTLIIPPISILLGALVRDEALPANAYLGFAILSVGLIILSRSGRRD